MAQFSEQLEEAWLKIVPNLASIFTTQDYVEVLKQEAPDEWALVVARHGPGGQGSGNYYSPANIVFNFLRQKADEGVIFRRQFVPSLAGWGSHLVAQWELSTSTSSLPPEEGDLEVLEGLPVLRQHLLRERAIGLRPKVLRHREKSGLACDCCGRAEPSYDIHMQRAMFEVHHKVPLASGVRKTKITDVDLLCATCHRLIHKAIATRRENVTAETLRKMLKMRKS